MDCPACHHENVDGARFCAKCGALLPMPSTQDQDSLVGQIIGGRYRITQLLGEGGMGRIYLAEQQMGTNVRKVAVKTLQAQFANDSQVLARFHRECGTVSELEHPNTIQFFDFGQTPDGQLYIAMEYVQGQSLAEAVQQGPMPPERVLRILAQVCGSLEEAHNRGVVHRDLKPDNVILTVRAGQPDFAKVLDFGIAKRSEAKDQAQEQKLTQQGMVLGTPPYMSPEQFTGKELDARSDIYSLGVMAYEMLTGRLPFDAETPWQWATQHMTAQPFPFEMTATGAQIPPIMKSAILRSLSKTRDDRQSSVRQFCDELAGAGPQALAVAAQPVDTGARGGTAAMPMPPDFAAATAATAAIPVAYTPPAHPAIPGVQGGLPLGAPTPMQAQGGGGSRKGLIVGLGATAFVLAIAGVIVGVRSMRPKEDIVITSPFGSGAAVVDTTPSVQPPVAAPALSGSTAPESGQATAPAAVPAKPVAKEPARPQLRGDEACSAARKAAESEDIAGAAAYYRTCDGANAASTKTAIARKIPDAVTHRVRNGDCNGARGVVAAAKGLGLPVNVDLGRCAKL